MNKKTLILTIAILILLSLACSLFSLPANQSAAEPPAESPAEEPPPASAPENAPAGPGDNPCNNIFYPLVPGQQMVYKMDTDEGSTQMGLTVAGVEGSQATVDMLDMSTGIITQSTIECDAGAIKRFPLVTMGSLFGNMLDGTLNMEYVSGNIAPSEATLAASNWDMSWESQYTMNGEMTFEEEGETFTILINDSPVVMKWQTAGTGQSLTVPAGSYSNVVKVTREMTMQVSLDMGGMTIDSNLLINSSHWFEPYVGLIKMQTDSVSVQYQGMTFPVTMTETMELIEFRPAE